MSNNYRERNEAADGFNLSKEEFMNCFGSQIASQSSKSNYDYQNECKENNENSPPSNPPLQNLEGLNKDDFLKNICHGFIDMFFSQKEELKGIKDEIKKLQNIIINNGITNGNINNLNNNNVNKKSFNKKIKNNNQKSSIFNLNNNDNFNYNINNSKNNPFLDSSNNSSNIFEQNNQNKRPNMSLLSVPRKSHSKSHLLKNPKSTVPEIVQEVDEEYELTTTRKQKNSEERENINNQDFPKNNFDDPFLGENPEENQINFDNIVDDEFDELIKRGKNRKNNNKMLLNDPFKKSSELKKRPDLDLDQKEQNENKEEKIDIDVVEEEQEKKEKNDDLDLDEDIKEKAKDKNLGVINLDLDEMQSDFMAGGKKVTVKLNDNVRKKLTKEMSSLDEPVNILEELSKNKQPSNIIHNNSKLSCSSTLLSKNKEIVMEMKLNNNNDGNSKKMESKVRPGKRNYNTMLENSKKIYEDKKNGSSVKERGGFIKKLRQFEQRNEHSVLNNISNKNNKSNPPSQNIKITTQKKLSNNKKYMFSTISTFEFYCLCHKKSFQDDKDINLIENSKCKICKSSGIINRKNFEIGFYYYILHNKKDLENIKFNDSVFKLLKKEIKDLKEKDPNYSLKKELEQFFNYQFIFLVYDKYIKISREKENNLDLHLNNLIEEIYSKLVNKYVQIYVKSERSFLTQIAEGEGYLGYGTISLLLMNIANSADPLNGDKIIEFSDGYKSCFANISQNDPIQQMLNQMVLHNWMNVNIAMAKLINNSEDNKVFIKIYYNSISPVENSDINNIKYGPLTEDKNCLLKNILELRNDGGEISLINIIISKKYEYYVTNHTKKTRYSRKVYENTLLKFPESSEKKKFNNALSESEEKNNKNNNEIKEPDTLVFHFKAIAMDYEIYNTLKKGDNFNNKYLENLLKKRYTIEFFVRHPDFFESIQEGKMYQLMFLNLESKNNSPNNNKNYFKNNSQENNIQIRFNDKSKINEIPLNVNYKTDKAYNESIELIKKNLNLTNNIDIGELFTEMDSNDKAFNSIDYLNKEFCISGIYSGHVDKVKSSLSQENELNENEEEHIERYIFLSIGISKVAIIKLHKDDFFPIDVKSNTIKEKIITFSDIIFKEIIYFDDDNNQPKITGKKRMKNSIPLLNLKTNYFTSINFGNSNKNKEKFDMYIKYRDNNKKLVEMLNEVIG